MCRPAALKSRPSDAPAHAFRMTPARCGCPRPLIFVFGHQLDDSLHRPERSRPDTGRFSPSPWIAQPSSPSPVSGRLRVARGGRGGGARGLPVASPVGLCRPPAWWSGGEVAPLGHDAALSPRAAVRDFSPSEKLGLFERETECCLAAWRPSLGRITGGIRVRFEASWQHRGQSPSRVKGPGLVNSIGRSRYVIGCKLAAPRALIHTAPFP